MVLLFSLIVPWLFVGVLCWLVFELVRQNGRILLRFDRLGQQLARGRPAGGPAPPLPVGAHAPAFTLPDLSGQPQGLAQFRGQRVLLIFFNPDCGFCTRMAPALAQLPPDGGDGRPVPLVVTTGGRRENRRLVKRFAWRCPVLLQEGMEIATQYQVSGTPVGYLIDARGLIASEQAVGSDALLRLAAAPGPGNGSPGHQGPVEADGQHRPRGKLNKGLAHSHLKRDGLKAGTPAPGFRLPRVGGGELALEAYRGRRVLLVFSDPQCGPCDQLAPRLERLHRERSDLSVLMISRKDVELNRQKIANHGLTFPVALQQGWEVSLRYAMFTTPVGYLIDEQGVIAADVAVGFEAIPDLVGTQAPAG
jgi:peroxiredoxin